MTEKENQQRGIRINKYLSEAGVCSRRAADCEIEAGNVKIEGRTARAGDRVQPGETVFFSWEAGESRRGGNPDCVP